MYSLSHTDTSHSINDLFKDSFIVSFSNDSGVLLLFSNFIHRSSKQGLILKLIAYGLWVIFLT